MPTTPPANLPVARHAPLRRWTDRLGPVEPADRPTRIAGIFALLVILAAVLSI